MNINKAELVNFLLEHPDLSWEISGKIEEILLKAIDEFFDKMNDENECCKNDLHNLTCTITDPPQTAEIVFKPNEQDWIMKLSRDEGILFNRESYPDATRDEFANAIIEILEKCFTIKFEKKEPPYHTNVQWNNE